jgi:hypothetical protein
MLKGQKRELEPQIVEVMSAKSMLANTNIKSEITDEIVNHIYSTSDYSKFRFIYGNRELLRRKVIKLREAMKLDSKILSYPIIVNSNFQIIDGQHRFIALAELGRPVCYVIDDTFSIKSIAQTNTMPDKWISHNYLSAFCTLGYKDYKVFSEFMKTYDTNFTVTLVLFNGKYTGALYRDFAEGRFVAKHHKRAIKWIEMVQGFKPYIQDIHKDRHFVRAILNCFGHPEYNHKRMLRKMKLQGSSMIEKQMNRLDYIRQIEALYNWHEHESNQVRFF